MNFAFYPALVFAASLLVVCRLKARALYLVFFAAYTQNFALAYLYTNGIAGKDLCRSLLLFKEFLLLELFLYSALLLYRHFDGRWPRPLMFLSSFTAYCVLRFGIGSLFFGDFSAEGLRKLRMTCYPLQILTVSVAITWLYPEFSKKFTREMTWVLATLALVGIWLFLVPETDFWKQHADIASYNMDVKGDEPDTVIEEEGIPGTGVGREAFQFLSSFRAMGTFADPLAFGFAMTMPILLLAFYYQRSWTNILMLAISIAAIFFTFSRSSWIFVAISTLYLKFQKRSYALLFTLVALGISAFLMWAPLREFAASEYSDLSWTNPGGDHAEGIVWFYQKAFTDSGNILGKGMDDSVRKIPENGYAFLLEHFGFFAYASFIAFCFSLFAHLKKNRSGPTSLPLIAQAVPVCILIVMHTSQYPFAFSEYLFIWFIAGTCIYPIGRVRGGRLHEFEPQSA